MKTNYCIDHCGWILGTICLGHEGLNYGLQHLFSLAPDFKEFFSDFCNVIF